MTTALVIAATAIFIVGLFLVIEERTLQRDDARNEARRAGEERDAAKAEARIANDLLARYKADARVVIPIRRAVPTQRTGYEWPPLARAIEAETSPIHDGLAVETFVESIERWGSEAAQPSEPERGER